MAVAAARIPSDALAVAVVGPGLVGSAVIQQLLAAPTRALGLVAVANSRRTARAAPGHVFTAFNAANLAETPSKDASYTVETTNLTALVDSLASLPNRAVLVDCSSSSAIPRETYLAALRASVSIVTPNKKGFSDSFDLYRNLLAEKAAQWAQGSPVALLHESTVGAGLPVLSTLRDLLDTGDRVLRIEGILSGTLSYIFNEWGSSTSLSFSEVVTKAKELGYTEPDPRDDLNGMDFARKIVIMSRMCGLETELSALNIEQIVDIDPSQTIDQFMASLPNFDAKLNDMRARYQAEGMLLRYVGEIDLVKKSVAVKLTPFPKTHAFCGLRGSDNVVSFITERFKAEQPLIIRGPGAGDAVTAFGVYSDLLKVARSLKAIDI